MDERGSAVYYFIIFIVTVITSGFLYTLIYGVLNDFPAGPNTDTMSFLDYVLAYFMIPIFVLIIIGYLNSMRTEKSSVVYG